MEVWGSRLSSTLLIEFVGHLAISIAAGGVVYYSYGSHYRRMFIIAFLCLLIDVDHLSPFQDLTGGINLFHNIFFALIIPIFMAIILYVMERKKHVYTGVYTSVLFLVILMGHVVYDGIDATPVTFYYPLSRQTMNFQEVFSFLPFPNNTLGTVAVIFYVGLVLSFSYLLRLIEKEEEFYRDFENLKRKKEESKDFLNRDGERFISQR